MELDSTKIRRKTRFFKCVTAMPRHGSKTVGDRVIPITLPYVSFIDRPDIGDELPQ